MSNTDKDVRLSDRRKGDRRHFEESYDGDDRRVAQRRSNVADRRGAPRVYLQD